MKIFNGFITIKQRDRIRVFDDKIRYRNEKRASKEKLQKLRESYDSKKRKALKKALLLLYLSVCIFRKNSVRYLFDPPPM